MLYNDELTLSELSKCHAFSHQVGEVATTDSYFTDGQME